MQSITWICRPNVLIRSLCLVSLKQLNLVAVSLKSDCISELFLAVHAFDWLRKPDRCWKWMKYSYKNTFTLRYINFKRINRLALKFFLLYDTESKKHGITSYSILSGEMQLGEHIKGNKIQNWMKLRFVHSSFIFG